MLIVQIGLPNETSESEEQVLLDESDRLIEQARNLVHTDTEAILAHRFATSGAHSIDEVCKDAANEIEQLRDLSHSMDNLFVNNEDPEPQQELGDSDGSTLQLVGNELRSESSDLSGAQTVPYSPLSDTAQDLGSTGSTVGSSNDHNRDFEENERLLSETSASSLVHDVGSSNGRPTDPIATLPFGSPSYVPAIDRAPHIG